MTRTNLSTFNIGDVFYATEQFDTGEEVNKYTTVNVETVDGSGVYFIVGVNDAGEKKGFFESVYPGVKAS